MYNWKKWIWPGVFTSVILTAGTTFIKTEPIEGELSAAATNEISANHSWASIDISGRDITLSGTAPSQGEVNAVNKSVKDVYGVRVVRNNTELIPVVKPYTLAAEKKDGKLTVSGFAPNEGERANILAIAKKNNGGLEVVDDITLARGNPESVSGLNAYAIGALSGLATGAAKISDSSVSVEGAANEVTDYQGTLDYLSNAPEGVEIASRDIKPATVSPYTFEAFKDGGKLMLDGFAPSFEAKASIAESLSAANPDLTIENGLDVALGNPQGVDWTKAMNGIPEVMGMFDSGFVKILDSDMIFDGALTEGGSLDAFKSVVEDGRFEGLNIAGIQVVEPVVEEETVEVKEEEEVVVVEEEQPSAPVIPTADPYIWGVSKSESKITVFGNVKSDDERSAVIDAVTSTFSGIAVQDNQKLALGKPDGLDGLRTAVSKGMKFLESGTAKISGTDIKIFGKAKNSNLKSLATNVLLKGIPFENGLDIDIKAPKPTASQAGEVTFVEKPPVIDPYVWNIAKDENGVTVSGSVASNDERASVIKNVKSALGVADVKDEQTLGRGKPDGLDGARLAVSKGLKFLEEGSGSINGTQVNIFGKAKNNNIKGLATRVITKAMPSGYDTNVFIQAPESNAVTAGDVKFVETPTIQTVDPYLWSAVKAEDKITLTGNVTSEEERAAVVEAVKSTLSAGEVDDQQVLGLGKPNGYDAARRALSRGLKFLNEGQATISGTDASLVGVAKNNNIKNLVSRLVQKEMPNGYGLNLDLSSPESNAVKAGSVAFNPQPLSPEGKVCAAEIREFIDGQIFRYEVDSADFLTRSKDVADKLAAKMVECPEIHVSIEGHTDSYGTVEYNDLLSDARANGIRDHLITAGVDPSRLKAEGFGKSRPIASNRNSTGRTLNRRTLVTIVEK